MMNQYKKLSKFITDNHKVCTDETQWHNMYLHETLHLAKKINENYWATEGVNKKPIRMSQKIDFLT